MYIPTSVYDQSHEFRYGVFELIDADLIHDLMKDIFQKKIGMNNQYVIDPFTIRIQFAFRNTYNMLTDDYKYRIAIVNDKVKMNMDPQTLSDLQRFRAFLEGFSYTQELQRYRPLIRIQSFINLRKQ